MHIKSLAIFAIIATGILSLSATGLIQSVSADKDCSVGQILRDKPSGKEWGQAVSEFSKENQGAGQEVFKPFNEACHSD